MIHQYDSNQSDKYVDCEEASRATIAKPIQYEEVDSDDELIQRSNVTVPSMHPQKMKRPEATRFRSTSRSKSRKKKTYLEYLTF